MIHHDAFIPPLNGQKSRGTWSGQDYNGNTYSTSDVCGTAVISYYEAGSLHNSREYFYGGLTAKYKDAFTTSLFYKIGQLRFTSCPDDPEFYIWKQLCKICHQFGIPLYLPSFRRPFRTWVDQNQGIFLKIPLFRQE